MNRIRVYFIPNNLNDEQINSENNTSSELGRKSKAKSRVRHCPLENGKMQPCHHIRQQFPHVGLLSRLAFLSTFWLIAANTMISFL